MKGWVGTGGGAVVNRSMFPQSKGRAAKQPSSSIPSFTTSPRFTAVSVATANRLSLLNETSEEDNYVMIEKFSFGNFTALKRYHHQNLQ